MTWNPTSDYIEASERVLRMLRAVTGLSSFFICRCDRSGARVETALPNATPVVQEGETGGPLETALMLFVCRGRERLVMKDTPLPPEHRTGRIRAFLGVPIILRDGQIHGALCAAHTEPHDFTEREIEAAESLASFLSNAVDLNRVLPDGLMPAHVQRAQLPTLERVTREAELNLALHSDQFRLHYQPIVNLSSGKIDGIEALVRWEHPQLGLLPPASFIPLADESGLITEIGEWVLRHACREKRRWEDANTATKLTLNVNLSPRQFQDASLPLLVKQILDETGMDPSSLCLEITEDVAVNDLAEAIRTMRQLKAIGVTLALDDFGTGYSSLRYLRDFPIDCIKIDRAFTAGIGRDARDEAIVRAILTLGQSLGHQVIAEGVENPEQMTALFQWGCHHGQGYLFSHPLTVEQLRELLARAVA